MINGNIDCDYNKLINLKYSPKEVFGDFSCCGNELMTLKYSPEIIHGSFFCNCNKLISLQFLPEQIHMDLDCSDNKLTTFDFFPDLVNSLNISQNLIEKKELANFNTNVINHISSDFRYNSKEDFMNAVYIERVNKEKKDLDLLIGYCSILNKKRL